MTDTVQETEARNTWQLKRAAQLADLGATAHNNGVLAGWVDYIKAEAAAIGVTWERMERAIARRTSPQQSQDDKQTT